VFILLANQGQSNNNDDAEVSIDTFIIKVSRERWHSAIQAVVIAKHKMVHVSKTESHLCHYTQSCLTKVRFMVLLVSSVENGAYGRGCLHPPLHLRLLIVSPLMPSATPAPRTKWLGPLLPVLLHDPSGRDGLSERFLSSSSSGPSPRRTGGPRTTMLHPSLSLENREFIH
jgi:hypothetical protein